MFILARFKILNENKSKTILAENAPIQSKDSSDQNKQSEILNKSDLKTGSTIGKETDSQKPPVPPGGMQLPPGVTGMFIIEIFLSPLLIKDYFHNIFVELKR